MDSKVVKMNVRICRCTRCRNPFIPRFRKVAEEKWEQILPTICPHCHRQDWQFEPRKKRKEVPIV